MEKIININFQGRVIPIEETSYTALKVYLEGLKRHLATEQGSDEIIHDIENRIAELFSERLKRGAICIGQTDLNAVMDSIGRLEDIEAADGEEIRSQSSGRKSIPDDPLLRGHFFRNTDDKVIAGVCSGIAIRTGIDPVIVRVLFVLLFSVLTFIYIVLWIIVPARSIKSNITRRLYRNPDDKMVAGVCGGLAVYFRTETWVIRLIFLLPFILEGVTSGLSSIFWHWHWGFGHRFFTSSIGGSLFISYIVLWVALPFASSSTDKLEMRGEKIDLNSIKAASQSKAGSPNSTYGNEGGGFGRIIGILFKSFFLFITGVVAFSLFCVLIALLIAGMVAVPYTKFFLAGWAQHTMAWVGMALAMGIPFLAFLIWVVRRLMGIRTRRHYLGFIFAGLWFAGIVTSLILTANLLHNFSSRSLVEEDVPLRQPSVNKLYIAVSNDQGPYLSPHVKWYSDINDNDMPLHLVNEDSLWLNTVKINISASPDSQYHIYKTRLSRGGTPEEAKALASHVTFNVSQNDSIINLPRGFKIGSADKFRNQQVLVTVEVPVGKAIQLNKEVNKYSWFDLNFNGGSYSYEEDWDNDHQYKHNSEYRMTPSGLVNKDDTTEVIEENDNEE